jgi:hypothetical protein
VAGAVTILRGERVLIDLATGALSRPNGSAETIGRVTLSETGNGLVIEALCIDGAHRGYGAGSEAARMLVAHAAAGPWDTLRAWAPPQVGLAVYFWSRMGLRPLFGERGGGGIWFERRVK